jgi:hypothetical protein
MMLLDLEAQEQGEWFQFFSSHIDEASGEVVYEEPSKDARVKIRSMVPFVEEQMAGRKKQYEHVMNPKTRSMERIAYYLDLTPEENKKDKEDIWDYVVQDLEGFVDKKTGKEIACTKANKIKLMKLPVFDRFVARCLQMLSSAGIEEQETKNSLTGSSGKTTTPDSV